MSSQREKTRSYRLIQAFSQDKMTYMTYGKPGKLILDFFIKPVLDYSDLKGGETR